MNPIVPQYFPLISIALNVLYSVLYLLAKDYARSFYWILAGLITFTVTFWIK
jgi:uncharacterized MAPEG superfamily protein